MSAIERLEGLLDRYDGDLEFSMASQSFWGGQMRLTLTNPDEAPSRNITFYSVAGHGPEDVAERLLADAETWLAESGTEPLTPPDC